jgi:hypothetical protein
MHIYRERFRCAFGIWEIIPGAILTNWTMVNLSKRAVSGDFSLRVLHGLMPPSEKI